MFGMTDYDPVRGYLNTTGLRWSYAAMKGRPDAAWQQATAALPAPAMVERLRAAGFNAIWVQLNGFEDGGTSVLAALDGLLGTPGRGEQRRRLRGLAALGVGGRPATRRPSTWGQESRDSLRRQRAVPPPLRRGARAGRGISLSPLLGSGFMAMTCPILGLRRSVLHAQALGLATSSTSAWPPSRGWAQSGRFFPLSAYSRVLFYFVDGHALALKLFVLALILVDLGLLGYLTTQITSSRAAGSPGDPDHAPAVPVSDRRIPRPDRGLRRPAPGRPHLHADLPGAPAALPEVRQASLPRGERWPSTPPAC